MKRRYSTFALALALIALSAVLYLVHYFLFRDPSQEFYWLVMNLAFIPIEVLLVTVVLAELIGRRERQARLEKLNMIIGVFFSEMGTELLRRLKAFDPDKRNASTDLVPTTRWKNAEFDAAVRALRGRQFIERTEAGSLPDLKSFLLGKRDLMLRLMENPSLLEQESFAQMLWAISHLAEELAIRDTLDGLPKSDLNHISNDMTRAYSQMIVQWLLYMRHLRGTAPYLYSLALRTNPFEDNPSPFVTE